jgi:uncharacterized membrane protein
MNLTDSFDRHSRARDGRARPFFEAAFGAAFGVSLCVMTSSSLAVPPQGRMPPEERQRLRQELRQHSGNFQTRPFGGLAVPQSSGAQGSPANLGQMPVQSAPPPAGAGQYPTHGARQLPPGFQAPPGRLSDDDRRALRQQLREQRAQREAPVALTPGQSSGPAPVPSP